MLESPSPLESRKVFFPTLADQHELFQQFRFCFYGNQKLEQLSIPNLLEPGLMFLLLLYCIDGQNKAGSSEKR
jgi:hypothetical protein